MLFVLVAITCPSGMVYQQCGPSCPQTCESADCGGGCVEGCFCPNGQVLFNGKCIDQSECLGMLFFQCLCILLTLSLSHTDTLSLSLSFSLVYFFCLLFFLYLSFHIRVTNFSIVIHEKINSQNTVLK